MTTIFVSELVEGQCFSEALFMEADNIFVPANTPIRKKDLELLKALDVTELQTNGFLVTDEDESDSEENHAPQARTRSSIAPPKHLTAGGGTDDSPETLSATSGVVKKLLFVIKQLDITFLEIGAHTTSANRMTKKFSVRKLWALTTTLLQIIETERVECLSFIVSGYLKKFSLAKNAVSTMIISVLIAMELRMADEKIQEIAVGALLHDIGMLRLPEGIVSKTGGLTAQEAAVIRSHTAHSYTIITSELAYSQAVAAVALQHHERWDGTGYPHKIAGNAIDVGARIVAIADSFDAMLTAKPYRDSLIGYYAMKNLVADNSAHFAPNMLKTFVRIMGMYPIGSGAALNDGRIVRIVDVKPDFPLRPVVRIIAGSGATRVDNGPVIDLTENKQIYITQPLDISTII